MPAIRYIYTATEPNPKLEKVVSNAVNIIAQKLKLPSSFEIEVVELKDSTYAETLLHPRFNRIKINSKLDTKELIVPLIHELIHLHQIYVKDLQVKRQGLIFWKGKLYDVKDTSKLSYEEYQNLPWEYDVVEKQKNLLEHLLKSF